MTENLNQPRKDDAVLGGQNPPPIHAVVLGGIEGIKRRLANPEVDVRVAALADALNYGEAGLNLVIQALQDELKLIQFTAYSLLKDRTEPEVKQQLDKILPFFEFDVITVDAFGQEINRRHQFAQYFTEDLGNDIFLEMVLIPGGTFLMGSLATEKGHYSNESPQHQVTVPSFFMGKYVVTQPQWQAVAALPEVNIPLKTNPSYFKGETQPVEKVIWREAVEFCARLSQKTGRIYRLPSEAEWEYACRAGTTTPFYFGETITRALAKCSWELSNPGNPFSTDYSRTIAVGSSPPNAFGLYDMHGNILEWCADSWHINYEDAPDNGSAWQSDNNPDKVLRGGSFLHYFDSCRSASRCKGFDGGYGHENVGFRVGCSAA